MIKKRNLHPSLQNWLQYELPATPTFGKTYFVKKTGSDSQNGLTAEGAFLTIQKAITVQIAETEGLGDVINVLPGTYDESLRGTLTNVHLKGVGRTLVAVAPTGEEGGAYEGTLVNSTISGIQFIEGTHANSYGAAAIGMPAMRGSLIKDCLITGRTGYNASVGIRIGSLAPAASEAMFQSTITRVLFDAAYGRTNEWAFGICFGDYTETTHSDTRVFMYSEISHCDIYAEQTGIRLVTEAANGGGIIRNNTIGSRQNLGHTSAYGIRNVNASTDTDLLTKILWNDVAANLGAINGFTTGNVMGNMVSLGGATPTDETISA